MNYSVICLLIRNSNGTELRIASNEYRDPEHRAWRVFLAAGIEVNHTMSDAFAGRTTMSHAQLRVINVNGFWDNAEWSGRAELRGGSTLSSWDEMDVIMVGNCQLVGKTADDITLLIDDGQRRDDDRQVQTFDINGNSYGDALTEVWGVQRRVPLQKLTDGDRQFGIAGPVDAIGSVYVGDDRVSSGVTKTPGANPARVVFNADQSGSVFADINGADGLRKPGELLYGLLTRTVANLHGQVVYGGVNNIELDSLVDNATQSIVGKTITIYRDNGNQVRTITAYNAGARIAMLDSNLSPAAETDQIFKINVSARVGGYKQSDVDITGFDDLDAEYPDALGLIASGDVSQTDFQDRILGAYLANVGIRTDGKLHLYQLQLPNASAFARTIHATRIHGGLNPVVKTPVWRVIARWRDDATGGHWRTVVVTNTAVRKRWSHAATLQLDTPCVTAIGARRVARLHLDRFGRANQFLTMAVNVDVSEYNLGDVVRVTHPRHGYDDGKLCVVTSISQRTRGLNSLGVWSPEVES